MSEKSVSGDSLPEPPPTSDDGETRDVPGSSAPQARLTGQLNNAPMLRHLWRAYRKTGVLLMVATLAGVGALISFPTDAPVAPSGGVTGIEILAPFAPSSVGVAITDLRSQNSVALLATLLSPRPQRYNATVEVNTALTTYGGFAKCAAPPVRCVVVGNTKQVIAGSGRWRTIRGAAGVIYETQLRLVFPKVGFNTARNAEYVAATLPNVQTYLHMPATGYVRQDVGTSISLTIPNSASYSWTSGSPPSVSGAIATWYFATPLQSAQVANGISLPIQDRDSKLIFVAGALLGIAGGALVGAIQEAVKRDEL